MKKRILAAALAAGVVLGAAGCSSGPVSDTGAVVTGDRVNVVTIETPEGFSVTCATYRRSIDCDWEGTR